ncbi:MAG: MotA/TolQ/ExbB proton channel family protein [Opitutaceae bacterium]|jgi:biopolymer transport protein TolQ|nr:MotA/TolQ/ExbB proton channel family protein [Opitutaceae bacterium]
MCPPLATVNLIEMFLMTDFVGQLITSGLLLGSLVAWTVMIGKHFELSRTRRMNLLFEARLRGEKTLLDQGEAMKLHSSIPYADVCADAIDAYWRAEAFLKKRGEDSGRARMEHAENGIQRAVARWTLNYESSMIFLATIVTGAPFLGLLGTVWGVMDAFGAVAAEQSASLRALAPGVSAALMTTVAGLVVAIPSVFGYNFLLGRSRQLTTELENYASSLADRLELESAGDTPPPGPAF